MENAKIEKLAKMDHFQHFQLTFVHSKCKRLASLAMLNKTFSVIFKHCVSITSVVNCNFLQARDGPTQSSPLIGKYCGNAIFPTIHSSGSNLWFKYVIAEGGRNWGRNYELFYTSSDQGMGCGGTLYNTRGVVTSPNFPQAHAQLSNCQWTLKVPPGQKIELRFTRKKKKLVFHSRLCDIRCT